MIAKYATALAGALLAGSAIAGPVAIRTTDIMKRTPSPLTYHAAKQWDHDTLFAGSCPAIGLNTGANVDLDISLPKAAINGDISIGCTDDFLLHPTIAIDLSGLEAYLELDLHASASVHESLELLASGQLGIEVPGLLELGIEAGIALDLVIGVSAAIDIEAGFHLVFPPNSVIEISLLNHEIVGGDLANVVANILPIGLGLDVDLDAEVKVTIGLRARVVAAIGAGLDIVGLDIGAGAEVAVWINLFSYTQVLVSTPQCALSVAESLCLDVGVAVDLDVNVAGIADISLAPTVSVTLAVFAAVGDCKPTIPPCARCGHGGGGYSELPGSKPTPTGGAGHPGSTTAISTTAPSPSVPTGGIPTGVPTGVPTGGIPTGPSGVPSGVPTGGVPTGVPSGIPTGGVHTSIPTGIPSSVPTGGVHTGIPTGVPSGIPTGGVHTGVHTGIPTGIPSGVPTGGVHTVIPTSVPSGIPTGGVHTSIPSSIHTGIPSGVPTGGAHTGIPTGVPTTGVPSGSILTGGVPTGVPSGIPAGGAPTGAPSGGVPTTIVQTTTYIITQCAVTVPNCPASHSQVVVTSVTNTIVTTVPTGGALPVSFALPGSVEVPVPTETRSVTLTSCPAETNTFTPPANLPSVPPTYVIPDAPDVPTGGSQLPSEVPSAPKTPETPGAPGVLSSPDTPVSSDYPETPVAPPTPCIGCVGPATGVSTKPSSTPVSPAVGGSGDGDYPTLPKQPGSSVSSPPVPISTGGANRVASGAAGLLAVFAGFALL